MAKQEEKKSSRKVDKKLLEKPLLGGIAVPIAIILVGAFIIFGVTKMLSTERSHRDLIEEMHSKTFGNRWVAAYELSKLLASSQIPEKDMPYVIENLSQIYRESQDARTRNFIVLALGSLQNPTVMDTLNMALKDPDDKVRFNAVVSIANMPNAPQADWETIKRFLDQEDPGLQQVAALALAEHEVSGVEEKLRNLLQSKEPSVRYAAAFALVRKKNKEALNVIEAVFQLPNEPKKDFAFTGAQVESLKLNAVSALAKSGLDEAIPLLETVAENESNIKVSTRAQQALNVLKEK